MPSYAPNIKPNSFPIREANTPIDGIPLARVEVDSLHSQQNMRIHNAAHRIRENTGYDSPLTMHVEDRLLVTSDQSHKGNHFQITPVRLNSTPLFGRISLEESVYYKGDSSQYGIRIYDMQNTIVTQWKAVAKPIDDYVYQVDIYLPQPYMSVRVVYEQASGNTTETIDMYTVSTEAMSRVDTSPIQQLQYKRLAGANPLESRLEVGISSIVDPRVPFIGGYRIEAYLEGESYYSTPQFVSLYDDKWSTYIVGDPVSYINGWQQVDELDTVLPRLFPASIIDGNYKYKIHSINPSNFFRIQDISSTPWIMGHTSTDTGYLPSFIGEYEITETKDESIPVVIKITGFNQTNMVYQKSFVQSVTTDQNWVSMLSVNEGEFDNATELEIEFVNESYDIEVTVNGEPLTNQNFGSTFRFPIFSGTLVIQVRANQQAHIFTPRYYVKATDAQPIELVNPSSSAESSWYVEIQRGQFEKRFYENNRAIEQIYAVIPSIHPQPQLNFIYQELAEIVSSRDVVISQTPFVWDTECGVFVNGTEVPTEWMDTMRGLIRLNTTLHDSDQVHVRYKAVKTRHAYLGMNSVDSFLPLDCNPIFGHQIGLNTLMGSSLVMDSSVQLMNPIHLYLSPCGYVQHVAEETINISLTTGTHVLELEPGIIQSLFNQIESSHSINVEADTVSNGIVTSIQYTVSEQDNGETCTLRYPTPATERRIQPGSGSEQLLYHSLGDANDDTDVMLGSVILRPHQLPEHMEIEDIRKRGGGKKQAIQGQFLFDKTPIDGIPYPTQGVIVVESSGDKVAQATAMAKQIAPFGHIAIEKRWDTN